MDISYARIPSRRARSIGPVLLASVDGNFVSDTGSGMFVGHALQRGGRFLAASG